MNGSRGAGKAEMLTSKKTRVPGLSAIVRPDETGPWPWVCMKTSILGRILSLREVQSVSMSHLAPGCCVGFIIHFGAREEVDFILRRRGHHNCAPVYDADRNLRRCNASIICREALIRRWLLRCLPGRVGSQDPWPRFCSWL